MRGGSLATPPLYGAPLCPAGHLPLKGGDWPSPRSFSRIYDAARMSRAPKLPISPQEGEMSGRTEGGAVGR
ncbi:MAG: lytic murein transglycosylase [Mesorhizobium sp.]|nr:MAG: lytic murein transglycosylase [Mesorhizobium sp.]TJU94334.1 MAG: lytic murein transglycosylase [Mesorhizobium sp.]TJV16857.1 MAG: lytic murein transglycosylase [Mesorhizobium sp.]